MMQIQAVESLVTELPAQALVVGAAADEKGEPRLLPAARLADEASGGVLSQALACGDFRAKAGSVQVFYGLRGVRAQRVILVGLGARITEKTFQDAVRAAVRSTKAESLAFTAGEWCPEGRSRAWAACTCARTAFVAAHPRVSQKAGAPQEPVLRSLVWAGPKDDGKALEIGRAMAEAQLWAMCLGDLPPNVCTPEFLADTARQCAKEMGEKMSCTVLGPSEMEKKGMGGVLAVSRGSAEEPRFIELSWKGGRKDDAPVVFVGKGITFDAGGISLKPARGMDEMQYDMSGAACALALARFCARTELPLNVTTVVAACENLPSGTALKPSDVITTMSGLTVEVLNTDAEGRLILADCLTRAAELGPAVTVDMATLTGACVVALGSHVSGLFCEDESLTDELSEAADEAFDPVWPLPMGGVYREQIESTCADVCNVGNPPNAGASTAATFLSCFAPKGPWCHLDIAGPAATSGHKKRSTGRPVPLLAHWILRRAGRAL